MLYYTVLQKLRILIFYKATVIKSKVNNKLPSWPSEFFT